MSRPSAVSAAASGQTTGRFNGRCGACGRSSHSPAVAALSAAQLEYDLKIQEILQNELPGYVHGEDSDVTEDQAEAASLYGEYAIDFAAQAMRHALLAALSAIDLQMNCEERENIPENTEETSK